MLQEKHNASDQSERHISAENLRVEQWRAITKINHCVRNKKGNKRHREFIFSRKVRCAAEGNGGKRHEIGKPAGARMNQKACRHAINDSRKHEKKSRNHWEESSRLGTDAKSICCGPRKTVTQLL